MITHKCNGAGPITVTIYKNGEVIKEYTIPAPSVETSGKLKEAKRGPKPKGTASSAKADKFSESANWY